MSARDPLELQELLRGWLAYARGDRSSPPADRWPDGDGLFALRKAADVLAAGAQAPRLGRALGTELFRGQQDFNHAVVDVLEDLPWLARGPDTSRHVEARLGPRVAWRPQPPRARKGPVGLAVQGAKLSAVLAAQPLLSPVWDAAARSSRDLIEAVRTLALGQDGAAARAEAGAAEFAQACRPFLRGPLAAWLAAQVRFYARAAELLSRHGPALRALAVPRPKAETPAGASPSLSVLVAGPLTPAARAALVEWGGALEVLEPGQGDMQAFRGDAVLRLPGDEVLEAAGVEALRAALGAGAALAYGDVGFADGSSTLFPGWSPEALLEGAPVGGCFALRRDLAAAQGLTRADAPLEWLLRPGLSEAQVARVPQVVSHREAPQRPSAEDAEAVRRHLARLRVEAVVEPGGRGARAVHPRAPSGLRASLIVPFRDKVELLDALLQSLRRADPGLPYDLVLVSNGSAERRTHEFLERLRLPNVQWYEDNRPFNWSALNNAAARRAHGALLVFLNNDVEALQPGWLADLAGWSSVPGVGAVGARLLYPDGSVQHAGVVVGMRGLAGHAFARWRPEHGATPFGRPDVARNVSAVTGACLALRRDVFERVGGFDEGFRVSGGDVELCLRVRRAGLRVVCAGGVELVHHESLSRSRTPPPASDVWGEARAYAELLEHGDPFGHPLLSVEAVHGGMGLPGETPRAHALRVLQSLPPRPA